MNHIWHKITIKVRNWNAWNPWLSCTFNEGLLLIIYILPKSYTFHLGRIFLLYPLSLPKIIIILNLENYDLLHHKVQHFGMSPYLRFAFLVITSINPMNLMVQLQSFTYFGSFKSSYRYNFHLHNFQVYAQVSTIGTANIIFLL